MSDEAAHTPGDSRVMHGVSAPFIMRPIATSLLAVAVTIGGFLGYRLLPVSSLPQVDFPTILVTTQLPGANSETMTSLVTASLERQFGQIQALDTMTSTTSFGLSQITLQFTLDRDIDAAAQDVQAAINAAGSTLPKTLPYPPVYSKVNPADTPILTLALSSDSLPLTEIADVADTLLAQRLSEISGVGHVTVEGGLKPAVRIEANPSALAAYGMTLETLRTAIVGASVSTPKGTLDGTSQSWTIAANDQITDPDGYNKVVVAYKNNAPVYLSDVATVRRDMESTIVSAWHQGHAAVVIDIQRQPGANIVQTVARVIASLPKLQGSIPNGIKIETVSDRTETIRASVNDVQMTLLLSVFLVVVVVMLFLRSGRATIIAGVALPLSLIGTFAAMYFAGFSLDNLSLMALTIGTGFVIDDAIVMIENIVRHLDAGVAPLKAALLGAKEIGFTVISLTVSLIAVFIPLLFMSGLVGRLFREFAMTLTIAVVVSAVVSLTLTPMMCGQLLKKLKHNHDEPTPGWLGRIGDKTADGYRHSLGWVLDHQGLTMMVFALTMALTAALYITIPKGFLPLQDTGQINATVTAAPDISFPAMQSLERRVAEIIGKDPDVKGVVTLVGVGTANPTLNQGHLSVVLKPREGGRTGVLAVINRLKEATAGIPGATLYFQPVQDIQISTRASRTQYQYTLVDSNADELSQWSTQLVDRLKQSSILADVGSDLVLGGLSTVIDVDRAHAGTLGVTMQQIDATLSDAFAQLQVATIYGQSNQYRVVLIAQPRFRVTPSDLNNLYVMGASQPVLLSTIARIHQESTPLDIIHQSQFPAVTLSFNLADGAALGQAVEEIATTEHDLHMPGTVVGSYSGDAAEFATALAGEPWLILAAVVVIYLVLGILYESFIHPLTILSTLPSAGVGALLALRVFGLDLSIVGIIGIVLLMGIVKKNAIMMIDFALEAERKQGLSSRDAIVQACALRFRPIMMTTAAALLGAIPLALGHGIGSELRIPLGVSIIGGLLLSQIITLYTTPVIYLGMERAKVFLSRKAEGAREAA